MRGCVDLPGCLIAVETSLELYRSPWLLFTIKAVVTLQVTCGLLGPYQVGEMGWVRCLCHHMYETFSSQRKRCLLKQRFAQVRNIKSFQIVLQVKFGIRKCLG